MSVKFSFPLFCAFILGACVQSAEPQAELPASEPETMSCDAMFRSFAELPAHPPKTFLGYKVPEPLEVVDEPVDLDGDGEPDRILLARYGHDTDISKGPYTAVVVIGKENPAYTSLDKESAAALFRPSNIQSSAEHDFQYLTFGAFLFPFAIPNWKQINEPWTEFQYQDYFRSQGFPEQLTAGAPIWLRPTLARVGYIDGRAFLLLSAKPIEYDESGNAVIGYDSEGKYIGRRFEFLAVYKGDREIELRCARTESSTGNPVAGSGL